MIQKNKIQSSLQNIFGIEKFRTSQEEIITNVLSGKHTLVLMPTGMGKSLCYQLPATLLDGLTVVISPLISLMKDQVDSLKNLGIDAEFINSSLGKSEREGRYRNLKNGKFKLLYVAPERFSKPEFLDAVKDRKISLLTIDEAHCVSQWGHDFRPHYKNISRYRKKLGNPTVIALTATATPDVRKDIIKQMGFAEDEIKLFNEGICRKNLYLGVEKPIDEGEKFESIYKSIESTIGKKIIYFSLIKNIEAFSHFLILKKRKFLAYHGKLNPSKRKQVQKQFMEGDEELVLATNAFGMGIDRADIRLVVHADMPDSMESYYQEIGRAGRDGKNSECILYYLETDLGVQLEFLNWKNPDSLFLKKVYTFLQKNKENLSQLDYKDIQEKLVYKNRGDQRLQTALNLFDHYGITKGSIDFQNLKLIDEFPQILEDDNYIKLKAESDKKRLLNLFQYIQTESCRRDFVHNYFSAPKVECGNCDFCLSGI